MFMVLPDFCDISASKNTCIELCYHIKNDYKLYMTGKNHRML